MTTEPKYDKGLTYADAAEFFGVQVSTVKDWVRRGWLTYTKFGHKTVRFRLTDLEDYWEKHLHPSRRR